MQRGILAGIMMTLLCREKTTAKELAVKYEVSVRQINRYLDALLQGGMPIVCTRGRYGGVSVEDGYKLPATYFTKDELAALLPAVKSYQLQNDTVRDLTDKLNALYLNRLPNFCLRSDQLAVDAPMHYALQEKFALLQKAIIGGNLTDIVYHDKKGVITNRSIEPYVLLLSDNLWYVFAYCRLRHDFRYFKISRIASLIVSDVTFSPRQFDADCAANLVKPINAPYVDFGFFLNECALSDTEEWLGVSSVSRNADGLLHAEGKLPFDNYLFSRLLSFGDSVKVDYPDKLIVKLKQILTSALKKY